LGSAAPAPILLSTSFVVCSERDAASCGVVSDDDDHPREFFNRDDALLIAEGVRLCGMGHVRWGIVELDQLKRGPAPVGAVDGPTPGCPCRFKAWGIQKFFRFAHFV